jgi:hypothetical protein
MGIVICIYCGSIKLYPFHNHDECYEKEIRRLGLIKDRSVELFRRISTGNILEDFELASINRLLSIIKTSEPKYGGEIWNSDGRS